MIKRKIKRKVKVGAVLRYRTISPSLKLIRLSSQLLVGKFK